MRGDPVLRRQILDALVSVIVHAAVAGERHAQRPPAWLGDLRPEKVALRVAANNETGGVFFLTRRFLAVELNEHAGIEVVDAGSERSHTAREPISLSRLRR